MRRIRVWIVGVLIFNSILWAVPVLAFSKNVPLDQLKSQNHNRRPFNSEFLQ